MANERYPRIRTGGDALERGRQYGETARDRISRTVHLYSDVFARDAELDWETARELALQFIDPIRAVSRVYVDELQGIADGAGLTLGDIAAINVRSELKIGAMARRAREQGEKGPPEGCTTLGVTPSASLSSHTLLAQNWDWYEECADTVVVLEVEQEDGPNYVTVVEAGLLAKTGLNSNGVGIVTNLLASGWDKGAVGIPYHVSLRSLMDASGAADALARLQTSVRSSSATYMVGAESGLAFVAEGVPGDYSSLFLTFPNDQGFLAHTNHFTSAEFKGKDAGRWGIPSSPFRLERARRLMSAREGNATPGSLQHVLRDHCGDRSVSICAHPAHDAARLDRYMTVASVVMDTDSRSVWLAEGAPCENSFDHLDYSEFLKAKRPAKILERRPA
ncbi:MAG: hypothetical protein A2W26_09605 [Acidobacteria bacterium RBG_16_64_8]|nr:MAG: hypothetical protein A2W26_09605 [Acidobacteria bacterium RBG_16_64_8]